SDAMVQRKAADERLKLIESKTTSLDKATSDATKLYNNGMATYLEVITIQSNKLQNDLEANTIKLDKLIATINLYKALGGGVE
ncbi:MAG: outer membrane protein multidrug efflux system, partial [Bacteroidota bacterium]|nr:outer membrane protein multidrug efflux system [Bacteroidota bacterium]